MKTVLAEKPRIVQITDLVEQAAVSQHEGWRGINGFRDLHGNWWAYSYSLQRYRARQRKLQV